ncbi:hypothetical protein PHYC_03538 [Phycisphaerales bacterium]|nr:hypothetical protein PHYC_03538 [Phycisphaerales bacterium]
MTRELKLALIVGFSLVLVVTVLISDHLSRARTDPLDNAITERPALTPEAPAVVPDPRADLAGGPAGNSTQLPPSTLESTTGPGTFTQAPPTPSPVEITLSREPMNDQYADIRRVIEQQGGLLVDGTIHLPPAAGIQEPIGPAPGAGAPTVPNVTGPQSPVNAFTPPPVPVKPARDYVVVSGDSAYKIAKREYGNGELWRKLVEFNNGAIKPDGSLRIGSKIRLPAKEALTGSAIAVAPPIVAPPSQTSPKATDAPANSPAYRTYVIKKGDTLGSIASKELGTVKRAGEILELNRSVLKNPDVVPLGATIKLPARAVASRT